MNMNKKPGSTCTWFQVCPLKRYFEKGLLDKRWIEDYCFSNFSLCIRKLMEDKREYHPDNMLPDGTIDHNLR